MSTIRWQMSSSAYPKAASVAAPWDCGRSGFRTDVLTLGGVVGNATLERGERFRDGEGEGK